MMTIILIMTIMMIIIFITASDLYDLSQNGLVVARWDDSVYCSL
jgi:hypothetical protein